MDFITSKSDINNGIGHLDVHRVRGKLKDLPKQFTLEFWMKFIINTNYIEDGKEDIKLFDLYLYNDDNPTSIYDSGFVDGHEAFIDNDHDITSYISIFFQNNNLIFNINNMKIPVIPEQYILMWNHIALVLDANTSCTWYLNGNPIISYNCLNESFKRLLNKKFCRFLWTLYKKEDIQSYIYNINLNENTTTDISACKAIRYNKAFTPPTRTCLAGNTYIIDPFTNTSTLNYNDTNNSAYATTYAGPPLNDDGYLKHPIFVTPKLAHNSCNLNCLIYLPMQNYTDKDYGSLNLKWQAEQGYYGEAIHPYSSYHSVSEHISSTPKELYNMTEEYKYPDSVIFNTSHENLFYTFNTYNLYGPFYSGTYRSNSFYLYNLYSNTVISTDDLQYLNETGFTLDWFSISYNFNRQNNYRNSSSLYYYRYTDPFYFFNNLFIPCQNICNLDSSDVKKYTNTWKIYTDKDKTKTISGTFTTVIDLLRLETINSTTCQNNYEQYNYYVNTSNNISNCISYSNKYYDSYSNNNFDHIWKFGIDYGIHHYAIVFKPGYKIRIFFDGQLYELNTEFHGIVPGEMYLPYFNKNVNFSHFRMTPGCLWYDNTFDTTTDTRLFVQKQDSIYNNPSQKISDIEENNIALLYPVKNPETNYDRRYSTNVNADKTSDMQKVNFQISYDNIATNDNIAYDYEITGIGEHKPNKYESYPAIVTNTTTHNNNTLIFINHHLDNNIPWTVEFWVYFKQYRQATLNVLSDIFYLSGYGLDTLNNNVMTNRIGGFIGLKTSYVGDICVITNCLKTKNNNNDVYNSGRYFDGFKYILDSEENKININWIDKQTYKFNMNDWNHIAFSTDYTKDNKNYRTTCLYVNGQFITNTAYPIINLHKLFFYLGNKFSPLNMYFTGIQVTMGVSKYFNGNFNESKFIYNWEDC